MNPHRNFLQYLRHHFPSKRDIKLFWQRRTRGWSDDETWSLDYSLAKIILPRLKRFKEITPAHPADITREEWMNIIDKMIIAFEFASSDSRWEDAPGEYEKHQEGIDLFAKYFFALWW